MTGIATISSWPPQFCASDGYRRLSLFQARSLTPRLPWWDHVACVIKQTQVQRLRIERQPHDDAQPLEIDLHTTSRSAAITVIIRAFLDGTISDEQWFLDCLTERAEVDIDSEELGRKLFMTWSEVRQLADLDEGLTIGSHARSHRRLAGLDDLEQRDELILSKQALEIRLGRVIKALAYPYGWRGTYTSTTKALVAKAGYHLAFSSHAGINRFGRFDRYDISRLGVGSADSAALLRGRCAL